MDDSQVDFKFITQDQKLYKDGYSNQARTLIKSQAMRATGKLRKKAGTYGKHNLGQLPFIVDDIILPPVSKARTISREQNGLHIRAHYAKTTASHPASHGITFRVNSKGHQRSKSSDESGDESIPPKLPPSGLEVLMAEWGLGPDDLSGLIGVELGGELISARVCRPDILSGILSARRQSFFSSLPSRFGHFPFLDNALKCLTVMVKTSVVPSNNRHVEVVLPHYGRALESLQDAINHASLYPVVDILCATRILSLFELLYCSSFQAYERHLSGAARLLQLLGPDGFETEYEISLLCSLVMPIITHCARTNVSCFFEEENWQKLFMSTAASIQKRCRWDALYLKLSQAMSTIPTIFKDVTNAVAQRDTIPMSDQMELVLRLRQLREDFFAWRAELSLAEMSSSGRCPDMHGKKVNMLSFYVANLIVVNRMLGAMSSSCRGLLEDEAVAHAKEFEQLADTAARHSPALGIYVEQRYSVADAVLATTGVWRGENTRASDTNEIIQQWIFDEWCSHLPRMTSNGFLRTY